MSYPPKSYGMVSVNRNMSQAGGTITACSQASNFTQPLSTATPVQYSMAASNPSYTGATVITTPGTPIALNLGPNLSNIPQPPNPPPIAPIPTNIDMPVSSECYKPPAPVCPQTHHLSVNEPTIERSTDQHFKTCNTTVQDNNIHIQHNRTIVTNVNRNHHHLHRVIIRENNFHHYLTNNIIRAHDIHHQHVEHVRAEGKTLKDHKETVKVEPVASCSRGKIAEIECGNGGELAVVQEQADSTFDNGAVLIQRSNSGGVECGEMVQIEEQKQSESPCPYGQVNLGGAEANSQPPAPKAPPPFDPDRYISDSEDEDDKTPFNIAPVINADTVSTVQQPARQKYVATPRYPPHTHSHNHSYYTNYTPQVANNAPMPQTAHSYYSNSQYSYPYSQMYR